ETADQVFALQPDGNGLQQIADILATEGRYVRGISARQRLPRRPRARRHWRWPTRLPRRVAAWMQSGPGVAVVRRGRAAGACRRAEIRCCMSGIAGAGNHLDSLLTRAIRLIML